MSNKYPCKTCTLVPNPQKCDNINCVVWRKWFVRKWNETRKLCRRRFQK